ncbi:hypothetical protein OIU79_011011 [Salix purpurea]|uniref:Uncharacterized protein n=1 Tax=Salix purpurea TaxID=77065 RepID=A0A9Q0TAG6_SALPP|nr:hypothetical protein OIU79_011011 [Salix purpurea]
MFYYFNRISGIWKMLDRWWSSGVWEREAEVKGNVPFAPKVSRE